MNESSSHPSAPTVHLKGNGAARDQPLPALPEASRSAPPRALLMPRKKHHIWAWLVFLMIVGGGVYLWYHYGVLASQSAARQENKPVRVTPVVAVAAQQGDLPIYLDADGTVAALNMVVLRTRVDGQLVQVNFKEGQDVHKGDVLIEVDPRPIQVQIEQAEAQQAKDRSILENAQRDLQRYETAREAVPQQQLDTAAAQVSQNKAAIAVDQAVIDAAKLQLTYTKITAPIDGRIGLRNVDVGNQVHASDANGLATIMQVRPITVVFTLAQDTLPQVQKAMQQPTPPVVLAYDSGLTRQIASGTLTAIDNQIDVASGTYKLKATFENKADELFPNQMVNVRLLVDTRKNAVLVPTQAIQRNQQASFVYAVDSEETVEVRNVTPGPTEAGQQVIEKGLEAGELVVTDGVDRLQPGAKVKVQTPEEAKATTQPATRSGRRGGGGAASQAGRGR